MWLFTQGKSIIAGIEEEKTAKQYAGLRKNDDTIRVAYIDDTDFMKLDDCFNLK